MAATDLKGRTILGENDITMVTLFLGSIKHTDPEDPELVAENMNEVRGVLQALSSAGYAVLPQAAIDGIATVCRTYAIRNELLNGKPPGAV
jgi:hypothetical protein